MGWLNSALGEVVDALLYPFRGLPDAVGLAWIALLTSVAILLVFRRTSDQEALRRVKAQIMAGVMEIRLFRDDLRLILRAQWDILRYSLRYMRLSLVPMLWVLVPVVLLMIQLQFHFGYEPLQPGGSTLLKVKLEDHADPSMRMTLSTSEGISAGTPLLRIPAQREGDWRIEAREEGFHTLQLDLGNEVITKSIAVGNANGRISPRRPSSSWIDQLLYPVEPPVPTGVPVTAIEIVYGDASVSVLGRDTHWMVVFFILTIVFAFALQKPLRVTI